MTEAHPRQLALLASCTLMACAHDPQHDRKIPRPPKVERWSSSAEIAAPPELVWEVLVDFEAYAQWNPWLTEARGNAEVGASVDARVRLGADERKAAHRVFEVDAPRRLCWRDHGYTTSFATGSRCRTLEPDGEGGTRLQVELLVGGAFRKMVARKYGADLQAGMDAETAALARRAEALSKQADST
jgi:uncharacterized protein YndB with AHSA1/START domain